MKQRRLAALKIFKPEVGLGAGVAIAHLAALARNATAKASGRVELHYGGAMGFAGAHGGEREGVPCARDQARRVGQPGGRAANTGLTLPRWRQARQRRAGAFKLLRYATR